MHDIIAGLTGPEFQLFMAASLCQADFVVRKTLEVMRTQYVKLLMFFSKTWGNFMPFFGVQGRPYI